MKKNKIGMTAFFFFSLLVIFTGELNAAAAELKFSVETETPENQIDKSKSYFDLKMEPNQEQELSIAVGNTTSNEITVIPEISDATTNQNGIVEYSPSKRKVDEGAPGYLTQIVSIEDSQKEIILPANSKTILKLKVKMPENAYKGTIAGGITLKEREDFSSSNTDDKQGLTIENKYAYSIAILLSESDEVLTPELELKNVTVGQLNYRNTIFAKLKNTESRYINMLSTETTIYKKGSKNPLYYSKKEEMQMAPNTSFDLPISLEGHKMEAGEYTLEMKAEGSGQKWNFSKGFIIKEKEAKKYNRKDVTVPKNNFGWIIILLVAILMLLVILVLLLIFLNRRKYNRNMNK